jgi:hypothetical protein
MELKWESHTNFRKVPGFLGLAGYYRKFVRNISQISHPLTELLKKDYKFSGLNVLSKLSSLSNKP